MDRKEINSFGGRRQIDRGQIDDEEVKIVPAGYALNIFIFIIALPVITIAAVAVLLGDLFRR